MKNLLEPSDFYRLTYGHLDGKTRIRTNNGEISAPLPKYPTRPTSASAFRYEKKFIIWLFTSAGMAAAERRDSAGYIRFSQALACAKAAKLRWGKPRGSEADHRLAEEYLFAAVTPPYQPDPFFQE